MPSQAAYQRLLCHIVDLNVGPVDGRQQVTPVGVFDRRTVAADEGNGHLGGLRLS